VIRSARWLVPAAVAALVGAAALAPGASADLPAKSPQEVLVMAAEADVESFSGTISAVTGRRDGLLTLRTRIPSTRGCESVPVGKPHHAR